MTSENIPKIFIFIIMMLFTILLAALVTYTSGAIIVPPNENDSEALNYIQTLDLKKIIVDVDAGADDAIALLLALAKQRPGYPEIVAITCTNGNTNITNVVINVLKTLRVLNLKIPVYMGAYSSLLTTPKTDNYFGEDGFGDVPDPSPPTLEEAAEDPAAMALIKLAEKYHGELGIIALGPLTNLALAARLDSQFTNRLKVIVWLGGSIEGIGNIKPGIEFNAFMDPEANYIIFNNTFCPIVLVSWETCIYHSAVTKNWRQNVLGKINSSIVNFLNKIEEKSLQKGNRWSPCDAKAMALLLEPNIVTKAVRHNVYTVYQGDGKGALLVDYKDATGERKNVVIVKEMNAEMFKKMCIANFS